VFLPPFSLWILFLAYLSGTSSQAYLFVMSLNIAKHHILIKMANPISQKQMKYTASTDDKMKIELAVILFMGITTPSKMVDQNDDLS